MDENLKGTLRTILGLILAAIALAAGFMLYHKGHASADSGDLAGLGFGILAISLLLTGAVIIAFPVAHWLSRPAGKLFYAGEEFDRPQPMFSVCEGKRKSGHYQEAFDGFQKIAGEYPQETQAYIAMIEIAVVDMKNRELAHAVFHRGIATLQAKEDRDSLAKMYKAISSRMAPGPHADRHPVEIKKQERDFSEPRYFR